MIFPRLAKVIAISTWIGLLIACDSPEPSPDKAGPIASGSEERPARQAEKQVVARKPTEAERALDKELVTLAEDFGGTVGIAVHDVAADRTVHHNGRSFLPQQSVTKLWVALAAFDQVDRGMLELSERATIGREDLTLFHQPLRSVVNRQGHYVGDYGDLIERALTRSDNTANDAVLRRIGGPEAVEAFINDNALGRIRFGSDERTKQSRIAGLDWKQSYSIRNRFYEARDEVPEEKRRAAFESYLADPEDGASAVAIAEALGELVEGKLLSESSTERVIDTLSRTRSGPQRLKGGAPQGWDVAHKTGTGQFFNGEQSGYNDVGILTSPEGKHYGIAVMIARTGESYRRRMDLMQEVVRATARYDRMERAEQPDQEAQALTTQAISRESISSPRRKRASKGRS